MLLTLPDAGSEACPELAEWVPRRAGFSRKTPVLQYLTPRRLGYDPIRYVSSSQPNQ
jgi:hypothetical protein